MTAIRRAKNLGLSSQPTMCWNASYLNVTELAKIIVKEPQPYADISPSRSFANSLSQYHSFMQSHRASEKKGALS